VAQAYVSYQDSLTYLDNGAWDNADAAISDPGWGSNDILDSGLSAQQLANLSGGNAGSAPINDATLLTPTGMYFSDGTNPSPMAAQIDYLNVPPASHPGSPNLTPMPGYFAVATDGNPVSVLGPGGPTQPQLTAYQLGQLIQAAGWQPGQPIQLFSCFTGAPNPNGGNDFAQNLADVLDTTVIAPSTFGWVYPSGQFVIAPATNPSLNYNSPPAQMQGAQPNLAAPGQWNGFIPQHPATH
jgi:hypothetical protein